jgi:uncharacterized protein YjbI with pentapeptide repeats
MGARLDAARAEFASFVGADLKLSDFSDAFLWKAKLDDAVLVSAKGARSTLSQARLDRVKARGINLEGARADGARFDVADLTDAVLRELHAPGAGFEGANLEGADLSRSNLIGADLQSTKLARAKLDAANVSGANFTGCEGLTPDQLCSAHGWRTALLPGDQTSNSHPPFRIDEPGPLRRVTERVCGAPVARSSD